MYHFYSMQLSKDYDFSTWSVGSEGCDFSSQLSELYSVSSSFLSMFVPICTQRQILKGKIYLFLRNKTKCSSKTRVRWTINFLSYAKQECLDTFKQF